MDELSDHLRSKACSQMRMIKLFVLLFGTVSGLFAWVLKGFLEAYIKAFARILDKKLCEALKAGETT